MKRNGDSINRRQQEQDPNISKIEMADALKRSGYLLESRIDDFLRKKNYYVQTNLFFPDPISNKNRELDLYGLTNFPLIDQEFSNNVWNCLLIECVNNPQPIVFFEKESQAPFLNTNAIKFEGMPLKIISGKKGDKNVFESLPQFLKMSSYHHYCKNHIATQFCSFQKKRSGRGAEEWMASHDENHFDAFDKLVKATKYFSNQFCNQWKFESLSAEKVNVEFFYPILVIQGELLSVNFGSSKRKLELKEASHIQFETNINSEVTKEESFQIDVVTEKYFPEFIKSLEKESLKTASLLDSQKEVVNETIKFIHGKIGQRIHESRDPFGDEKLHLKKAPIFKKQIENEIESGDIQ